MKLGILLCDDHYSDSIPVYGHYDDAFKRMLAESEIQRFNTYRCFEDELPTSPTECDIWLVSGSKWGVYDQDPWIAQTAQFVRECETAGQPLIGICFGHQLIHHAFGGSVEKSDKGWGMGVYPIAVDNQPDFHAAELPRELKLIACHQDQVVKPAQGFDVVAGSAFCPVAVTHKPGVALTMQCHPEFTPAFLTQLLERLREKAGDEMVDNAIASMDQHGDGDRQHAIALIKQFIAAN